MNAPEHLAQPFAGVRFVEVSDGPYFVAELFSRKFGQKAPTWGRSIIGFYRESPHVFLPLCYTNFLPHDEVILVGGAMTDGAAFAHLPGSLGERIRDAGGIYLHLLRFAFHYLQDDCAAFFGFAGDARAYEVDLLAGFEPTPHEHLIAHFHKPISREERARLIGKIHALGPF